VVAIWYILSRPEETSDGDAEYQRRQPRPMSSAVPIPLRTTSLVGRKRTRGELETASFGTPPSLPPRRTKSTSDATRLREKDAMRATPEGSESGMDTPLAGPSDAAGFINGGYKRTIMRQFVRNALERSTQVSCLLFYRTSPLTLFDRATTARIKNSCLTLPHRHYSPFPTLPPSCPSCKPSRPLSPSSLRSTTPHSSAPSSPFRGQSHPTNASSRRTRHGAASSVAHAQSGSVKSSSWPSRDYDGVSRNHLIFIVSLLTLSRRTTSARRIGCTDNLARALSYTVSAAHHAPLVAHSDVADDSFARTCQELPA
jgi:hypothetical protein